MTQRGRRKIVQERTRSGAAGLPPMCEHGGGRWRCFNEVTNEHDGKRYCKKHWLAAVRRSRR